MTRGRDRLGWLLLATGLAAGLLMAASAGPTGAARSATADQTMPALVYNPHPDVQSFLLFWIEDRGGGFDIFAKRLFANGLPQGGPSDDGWRVLPASSGSAGGPPGPRADPSAAYNAARGEYLLVYSEVADEDDGWDTFAVRVSAAGYARGSPRCLACGPGDQRRPDVAPIGNDAARSDDYLVVWEDDARDIDEVWAMRVQANGIPRPPAYPLVRAPADASDPTTNGSAVVWVDDRAGQSDLYLLRLRSGKASGAEMRLTGSVLEEFHPRLSSDGLVWNVYHPLTGVDVMGVEIIENSLARADGAILVPAADQLAPDMDQGVVVFADNRSGDFDLFAIRAIVRGRPRALGREYLVLTDP